MEGALVAFKDSRRNNYGKKLYLILQIQIQDTGRSSTVKCINLLTSGASPRAKMSVILPENTILSRQI